MHKKIKCLRLVLLALFACFVADLSAQTVKGNVKDSYGEAVIGATVQEVGTKNRTVTDLDGNFSVKTSGSKKLQISYIGMKTQTVNAAGKSNVNVVLEDEASALNEVVVVGYGTVKKKDLTGSVVSVKGEAITKVPVPNVGEALAGKMSGVRVTTTDGSPDAEVLIRVRGGGSITGDNSPLYIIDGFPADNLNDISANDIEDITVLKDASSTAIYGSRGANGVILVTTKGGKAGATRITYNGFVQTKSVANRQKAMDTYDYIMSNYEYAKLRGESAVSSFESMFGVYDDLDIYKGIKAIDWQDDMFGANVVSTQQNVSLTGGTDKTKFTLSGTYDYNGGLMPNNDYSRFSFNFKLSHQINKKVKFNVNARISDQEVNGSGTQGGTYKIRTSQAITSQATKGLSAYVTPDFSSMSDDEYQEYLNSNMTLAEQAARYWRKRNQRRYNFNASLDWQIIKGLTLHTEGGYGYGFEELKNWWGSTTTNASYEGGLPLAEWTKTNKRSVREEVNLSYDLKLNDHKLNIMVGQEYSNEMSDYNFMHGSGYSKVSTAEEVFANFANGQNTPQVKSITNADNRLMSFFGRVNYTWKDRYLATITARYDGSSKFEDGNRWGFFPAAALSWRIVEEPWMESTHKWLSNLKLRASIGEAGNNRIKEDATRLLWGLNDGSKRYGVGDKENNAYKIGTRLANPQLTWETMVTRNIGLDFGFFNERINGSIEYYYNTTKDLLIEHSITAPGYTTMYENSGQTTNKGVELTINANIVNKKNFTLDANFNIGFNKSNVDKLSNGVTEMTFASGWAGTDNINQQDYIIRVGDPVGLIYGWVCDGYYTTSDFASYDPATNKYTLKDGVPNTSLMGGTIGVRPGTMKLRDISGPDGTPDGVVDQYDRTVIGDTNPTCQGGFGFNMTFFKNFDLSANFTYSIGNDVYNANKIAASQRYRSGSYPNLLEDMRPGNAYSYLNPETGELLSTLEDLAYWNEGGNGAGAKEYWSPFSWGDAKVGPTSWAIEDASFLRLQSLTLGYTLPKKLIQKVGIQNLRFYVTATNLFCITGYTGYDPEVSSYSRNSSYSGLTPGIDYSSYPKSRAFTFGLNLTL
jgi:TonB-dependent starch-binding outer membrane protein SusC